MMKREIIIISDTRRNSDSMNLSVSNQLGLAPQGITWEELKKYDITPDKVQKVSYAKGKQADQWTPEIEKMAKRIGDFILASADGDKEIASKQLETLTKWTDKDKK